MRSIAIALRRMKVMEMIDGIYASNELGREVPIR